MRPDRSGRGRRSYRRGRFAETLCVLALALRGWRVLARGASSGRGTGAGEIDIVARRGRTVAFIEVKARPTRAIAAAAVSGAQRRRLVRAAGVFLARRPDLTGATVRFDVMLVAPWRWPLRLADAWREDS